MDIHNNNVLIESARMEVSNSRSMNSEALGTCIVTFISKRFWWTQSMVNALSQPLCAPHISLLHEAQTGHDKCHPLGYCTIWTILPRDVMCDPRSKNMRSPLASCSRDEDETHLAHPIIELVGELPGCSESL